MALYSIYFSPTGGTKKVALLLARALDKDFETVDLLQKKDVEQGFGREDVCILAVPAFGGRVPEYALKKIKGLKGGGARAVLTAVFGNRAVDDTLTELFDAADLAGFRVIAALEAVAEHSLVRSFGAGRPNLADEKELFSFAEKISEKLGGGDESLPRLPGNRPYKEYKPSAMTLAVEDTCILCKCCARACPVGAIPMDNVKALRAEACFSCMHCVNVCPVGARHNASEVTAALEKRLFKLCAQAKPNKLYI